MADDTNAMDEILDTNWLEDFKQTENKYNMFYKGIIFDFGGTATAPTPLPKISTLGKIL